MSYEYDKNGKKILRQNGKVYRQNMFGEWKAETDWLGNDKVETDFFGNPKVDTDFFGNQKVETDFFGNPIVPDETKQKEGCYLTTACLEVQQADFTDDCEELQTLRHFRDNYMKERYGGEVANYYRIAPAIVEQINRSTNKKERYEAIYRDLINPTLELIKQGQLKEAYLLYKKYTLKLQKELEE